MVSLNRYIEMIEDVYPNLRRAPSNMSSVKMHS